MIANHLFWWNKNINPLFSDWTLAGFVLGYRLVSVNSDASINYIRVVAIASTVSRYTTIPSTTGWCLVLACNPWGNWSGWATDSSGRCMLSLVYDHVYDRISGTQGNEIWNWPECSDVIAPESVIWYFVLLVTARWHIQVLSGGGFFLSEMTCKSGKLCYNHDTLERDENPLREADRPDPYRWPILEPEWEITGRGEVTRCFGW